jgi:hypothetical protein
MGAERERSVSAVVLHGSRTRIFNDLSHTKKALGPQIGLDSIGIGDFTR